MMQAVKRGVRHLEVLAYLRGFQGTHGYVPTIKEIATGMGLSSTSTVHYHLTRLAKEGWIEWAENKNRSIRILRHEGATVGDLLEELGAENLDQALERVRVLVTIAETFQ